MTPQILVAQLGARKHYQEPLLFAQQGTLDTLYTDFYSGHNPLIQLLRYPVIYNQLPSFLKKGLDRSDQGLRSAKIVHFPIFAYQYTQRLKKATSKEAPQIFVWAGQEFCHKIIQQGLGTANIVYGFNSACLELFQYAKEKGLRCILDQTLVDYSVVYQLLTEEEQRCPGWSIAPFKVEQADLELMEREHQEQDIADHIICGSAFVKDSLIARGIKPDKITVISLGRLKESTALSSNSISSQQQKDSLKILFAGSVGLRKGIPYLLEALRQLDGQIPFKCKIAGSLDIQNKRVAQYNDICEFMGRVPRSQMQDLYQWADVLVLPSLCEGSAMVTYEALSLGIPIITTYNAGSLVRDKIDGFIIKPRDSHAIAEKLLTLYQDGKKISSKEIYQSYLKRIFQESQANLINLITQL